MMNITRDQFIRGFDAIEAHYASRDKIEAAMLDAGWEDSRIGFDPVVLELQRQLEERCDDTHDDPHTGTTISYALTEKLQASHHSGFTIKLDSAEAVWCWWEETRTGPFRPSAAHLDLKIESILHDLVQEIAEAERGSKGRRHARKVCARGAAKNAILGTLKAEGGRP